LCSDGLTSVLSDFEIAKILKKYSGQELVENLVAETKAKGAPDNVTVIWAEIVLEEDASSLELIGAARA
jgi:protein phosphatase